MKRIDMKSKTTYSRFPLSYRFSAPVRVAPLSVRWFEQLVSPGQSRYWYSYRTRVVEQVVKYSTWYCSKVRSRLEQSEPCLLFITFGYHSNQSEPSILDNQSLPVRRYDTTRTLSKLENCLIVCVLERTRPVRYC
jgi:hypothetical protein